MGSADSQDIQLCGMGIQAEHCIIDISGDAGVILTPHRNSRYAHVHQRHHLASPRSRKDQTSGYLSPTPDFLLLSVPGR